MKHEKWIRKRERRWGEGCERERERVTEGCDKGWEEIVRWKEKKKRVTKWHPTTK